MLLILYLSTLFEFSTSVTYVLTIGSYIEGGKVFPFSVKQLTGYGCILIKNHDTRKRKLEIMNAKKLFKTVST